jgi:hypothetical protein
MIREPVDPHMKCRILEGISRNTGSGIIEPVEKLIFSSWSKIPLPLPRKAGLRAGRQMQVEPCEIPFAGAPEILRSEAYLLNVRCNDEG